MDKITITGVPPLDGEYTVDIIEMITVGAPGCLTNREAHDIKTRTGLRVSDIIDALIARDNDLMIALATVALRRAGKKFDADDLWDATVGAISVEFADRSAEVTDENPPEAAPPSEENKTLSPSGGASSKTRSDDQENDPSPTGHPDSETLSTDRASALVTSAS